MNHSIRSLTAGLAAAICLWPVAAAAQSTGPTVEQVRAVYASAGFQVDSALNWDWTSPPVSTFRVHDASQGRELMVLVYPDPAAAQLASSRAWSSAMAKASGAGTWPWSRQLKPSWTERSNCRTTATTACCLLSPVWCASRPRLATRSTLTFSRRWKTAQPTSERPAAPRRLRTPFRGRPLPGPPSLFGAVLNR